MRHLPSVLTAAARLIYRLRTCDHITVALVMKCSVVADSAKNTVARLGDQAWINKIPKLGCCRRWRIDVRPTALASTGHACSASRCNREVLPQKPEVEIFWRETAQRIFN